MRILYIAGYNHPVYHRKVELLVDKPGVELLYVTSQGLDRCTGRYPSATGQQSYEIIALPRYDFRATLDPHRSILLTTDFCMRSFKPDIVHVEGEVESLVAAEITLAQTLWAAKSKLIQYSWQNLLRPRAWYVRWLNDYVLRHTDHVICASSEAMNVLRCQNYKSAISIMPLVGLDSRYFAPQPNQELRRQLRIENDFVVGYIGRLLPEKGIDTLLHAISELPKNISLLIVGDGVEKENLRNLAAHLMIAERCYFMDAIAYENVALYMNAMDALVLPSRTTIQWKEQFGRVLVEAMGCKCPVVGADSGAIPEVIGDAGIIFPEGNITELASALNRLALQPELRQALAERGYARAHSVYGVETLAEHTFQIWKQLCTNK